VAKLRLYGSRALVNMWVGVDDRQSDAHIIAVGIVGLNQVCEMQSTSTGDRCVCLSV